MIWATEANGKMTAPRLKQPRCRCQKRFKARQLLDGKIRFTVRRLPTAD
jgi:hypothetical protein